VRRRVTFAGEAQSKRRLANLPGAKQCNGRKPLKKLDKSSLCCALDHTLQLFHIAE
jgi:hypothetical protein